MRASEGAARGRVSQAVIQSSMCTQVQDMLEGSVPASCSGEAVLRSVSWGGGRMAGRGGMGEVSTLWEAPGDQLPAALRSTSCYLPASALQETTEPVAVMTCGPLACSKTPVGARCFDARHRQP